MSRCYGCCKNNKTKTVGHTTDVQYTTLQFCKFLTGRHILSLPMAHATTSNYGRYTPSTVSCTRKLQHFGIRVTACREIMAPSVAWSFPGRGTSTCKPCSSAISCSNCQLLRLALLQYHLSTRQLPPVPRPSSSGEARADHDGGFVQSARAAAGPACGGAGA